MLSHFFLVLSRFKDLLRIGVDETTQLFHICYSIKTNFFEFILTFRKVTINIGDENIIYLYIRQMQPLHFKNDNLDKEF